MGAGGGGERLAAHLHLEQRLAGPGSEVDTGFSEVTALGPQRLQPLAQGHSPLPRFAPRTSASVRASSQRAIRARAGRSRGRSALSIVRIALISGSAAF